MSATTVTVTPRAVSTARVRESLIDAALELFARDGFDATHSDRIAERAGVSPRTFFRYFPTKESVVFHRDDGFMRSFATEFVEQPRTLGDYAAVHATFVALAAGFGELRTRIETYRTAVDSSPVLVGREQEQLVAHARTIADAIAARHGESAPDDDAHTLAIVSLALYQRALRRWLDGPRSTELGSLLDDEFIRLHRVVR
jgi:AcrR family transcriptional regulator